MSDFRELLVIKSESNYGVGMGYHRTIEQVQAGSYTLSIQASEYHYCTPRETVPLSRYTHWEVAAFDADDDWMGPETHPDEFEGLACAERWEGGAYPIGPWISTEDVQALYDRLASLSAVEAA